jgi:alkylation response protein AidB-like acyl-CoA dehydrogenase
MRQALSIALNHTAQREAFGKKLIEQPLMRNVLADLALEAKRPRAGSCAWPAPSTSAATRTRRRWRAC